MILIFIFQNLVSDDDHSKKKGKSKKKSKKKRYWHKKESRKRSDRSISPTKPRKTSKSKLGVTVKGVPQFSDIDASDGEDYAPPKDLSPRSAAEYVKKKLKEDAARRKKRRRKKKLSEGMKYRVSNLKLEFLYGLLWRYGKCYDFGLLVCYTTDLRQFFGAKNPTGSDRK